MIPGVHMTDEEVAESRAKARRLRCAYHERRDAWMQEHAQRVVKRPAGAVEYRVIGWDIVPMAGMPRGMAPVGVRLERVTDHHQMVVSFRDAGRMVTVDG